MYIITIHLLHFIFLLYSFLFYALSDMQRNFILHILHAHFNDNIFEVNEIKLHLSVTLYMNKKTVQDI